MLSILLYFLLGVVSLCVVFELYFRRLSKEARLINKIPGPPEWPVIGGLLDIFEGRDAMFRTDRRISLAYYPIYRETILSVQVVEMVSPDDIEQVLNSTKHLSKGLVYDFLSNWLGNGLLTSTGDKWRHRRKILTTAFHFNILLDFLEIFNEETKNLVNVLKQHCDEPYVNVVKPITEYTLHSINETAMGVKLSSNDENNSKYKEHIYRIGGLMVYRVVRPWLYNNTIYALTKHGKEEAKVLSFLHSFTKTVIRQREMSLTDKPEKKSELSYSARKRLAMLDLLLTAKKEGDIDYDGIREEVDTFMFEGHDTTSMALCFALLLIANHKDVQDRIVEELYEVLGDKGDSPTNNDLANLKYMERCIKETLRLYPSVVGIMRRTSEEYTTTTGYLIPKDANIVVQIYDMHRNPNVFEDPEKFDPDRFLPENIKDRHPFAYIPFSAGPRNCIGQRFAMMELKAALCGILREFELLPVHKPEDIVILSDIILRPNEDGVRVKFIRRKRLPRK